MIRKEVDPSDILKQKEKDSYPIYDSLLKSLPITKDWEIFEKICLELLQDEQDLSGVRTFLLYGSRGQSQYGLDIVGLDLRTSKKSCCTMQKI